ncbi:hypothetical protein QM306_39115, partial [Burkholderia cenocepacia]|nr:hypothetical protein [Burkholderia cenocepacia]
MRSMSRRFNEFIGFLLDGDARGPAPRADSDSAGYRPLVRAARTSGLYPAESESARGAGPRASPSRRKPMNSLNLRDMLRMTAASSAVLVAL